MLRPPTLEKPTYKPPENTPPQEQWGSAAMAFAMLASLFTRRPMVTALNSAAEVMNAYKAGDKEHADRAYATWQAASKNAVELANYQQKTYAETLQALGREQTANTAAGTQQQNAIKAELTAKATAFKDQVMLDTLKERGIEAAQKLEAQREKMAQDYKLKSDKMGSAFDKVRKTDQITSSQEYKDAVQNRDDVTVARLLAQTGDPKAVKHYEQVPAGERDRRGDQVRRPTADPDGTLFPVGLRARGPAEERREPAADAVGVGTRREKQVATLNGPQMERFVGLAHSVDNTIDEVRRLSEEMQQSGMPLLNHYQLQAYIQAQGNSPEGQRASRYVAAVNTLKEEFANLANGGYAPTEATWKLANDQINGDYGVQQLGASLDEVQRLIKYRVAGIPGLGAHGPDSVNRYTGATGKPAAEEGGARPESGEKGANSVPKAPEVGETQQGYRFKGGDPAKPESWEKVPDAAPAAGGAL